MARKSQWAQFAENFKSTYEIGQDLQQGYATKQVMDDEKFMSKDGGAGYGLSGDNLERARYKALGDIATKYGDTAGGLANRSALADLNAKDRQNRMDANTFAYQERIEGLLAEQALRAKTAETVSSTGLNRANTADVLAMTPERVAKLQADTTGLELENASTLTRQVSADAAAIAGNEYSRDEFRSLISNLDLRDAADAEKFRTLLLKNQAEGATAELGMMETQAFLDYSTRYNNGEFETGKAATEAYVNVVAQFDPNKANELVNNYTENEISQIANQGLKFQKTVSGLVQKNDFEGIRSFFDEQNGDATGVTLEIDEETGGVKMFQTGAEGEIIPIMEAANAVEARAQLESITTYGNAATYAASLFERRKGEAGLAKTAAEVKKIDSTSNVLWYQAFDLAKQLDVDRAQINKIEADILKIKNDVKNSDQAKSETVRQEGLQSFLGGDTYPYLQESDPAAADTLLKVFKFQTGMLNMEALRAGGVSMEQYLNMPPEDQAQFDR